MCRIFPQIQFRTIFSFKEISIYNAKYNTKAYGIVIILKVASFSIVFCWLLTSEKYKSIWPLNLFYFASGFSIQTI